MRPGEFVNVRITGAMDYDLVGEIIPKIKNQKSNTQTKYSKTAAD